METINENVHSVEATSADKQYLVISFIAMLGSFMLLISPSTIHLLSEDILVGIQFIIYSFFTFWGGIVLLTAYLRRSKFLIYYSACDNVDIESIKEDYYVCLIRDNFIAFIDKSNEKLYCDWILANAICDEEGDPYFVNLKQIKKLLRRLKNVKIHM